MNVWSPLYRLAAIWDSTSGALNLGAARSCDLAAVKQLLPTVVEARDAWAAWLTETRTVAAAVVVVPSELGHDSESRRRYRPHILDLFARLPTEAQQVWSAAWRIWTPIQRRTIWETLRPSRWFEISGADELRAQLMALSKMAKKYNDLLFPEWKLFVDLHLLRDYTPAKNISEFTADIEDWVMGEAPHSLGGDPKLFLDLLRQGVDKFLALAPAPGREVQPLTVREWLSDPARWARSGSSDGPRLRVLVDGKVRKARKSKWASALAMSIDDLERLFYTVVPQTNKAIQKRELGKVRAVLTGDLANYLRMSYISYWLEHELALHPCTTLFYSARTQLALWSFMESACADESSVKMPLDEDEYDHNVNREMLEVANDGIEAFIARRCNNGMRRDLLMTLDMLRRSLSAGTVQVGSSYLPVQKGILSGWRWTALYDTILNGGKVEAFRGYLAEKAGGDPVLRYCSQGDDVMCHLRNYTGALALWATYQEAGFKVNAGKFFISVRFDEYLRQVGQAGLVAGYPSRSIPALVFRNPVTRELVRGEERIRESVSSWNTCFARVGAVSLGPMIEDVARSNHIPADTVQALLRTPACYGGLGFGAPDAALPWARVSKGRAISHWSPVTLPPLARALGDWGVAAEDLAGLWKDNVEPPGGTKVTFEPFEVEAVLERPVPYTHLDVPKVRSHLRARADPKRPPSVSSVLEAAIRDATSWPELDKAVESWLDPTQMPEYVRLRPRCSKRVVKAWLLGKLPFSVPVIPLWSSLAVSVLYERYAEGVWAWLFGTGRIGWARVLRAAFTVEVQVRELLAVASIRIGG